MGPDVEAFFKSLLRRIVQFAEELGQCRGLVMGVEAAGVGEDPEPRRLNGFTLRAELGEWTIKGDPIARDADNCGDRGLKAAYFFRQHFDAGAQFLGIQFIGSGCRAADEIGDSVAIFQQPIPLPWREQSVGESAGEERGPEAIARPAEMMADGGGVEAGIDADEQHLQVWRDQIRHRLARGGDQIGFGGFLGSGRHG